MEHEWNMNGPWNGDVWKVAHYLNRYCPDLRFHTLDCDWGVGVLSGFSGIPDEPDEALLREIESLDYSFLESNRRSILNLRHPLRSRFPL